MADQEKTADMIVDRANAHEQSVAFGEIERLVLNNFRTRPDRVADQVERLARPRLESTTQATAGSCSASASRRYVAPRSGRAWRAAGRSLQAGGRPSSIWHDEAGLAACFVSIFLQPRNCLPGGFRWQG